MKVNIGQKQADETNDIDYIYQNYRPAKSKSSGNYSTLYNKRKQDNKWIFQMLISCAILLVIGGIFKFNVPFTGPIKNGVRYLMNTETDVQPIFSKIVQLASQQTNMQWPLVDDIPQQTAAVSKQVPTDATMTLPVSGKVSRLYGWSLGPEEKVQVFHHGLDIEVPKGTEVKAAAKGWVLKCGEDKEIGKYVLVENSNGDMVRYANLSEIFVKSDQPVKAGEVIAKTGDYEDGSPHLHLEVIVNGKPVDPLGKLGLNISGSEGAAGIVQQ